MFKTECLCCIGGDPRGSFVDTDDGLQRVPCCEPDDAIGGAAMVEKIDEQCTVRGQRRERGLNRTTDCYGRVVPSRRIEEIFGAVKTVWDQY